MAAGFSRRFGKNKLLEPLAGKPLLRYVLESIPRNRFARIVAVASDDLVAKVCEGAGIACTVYEGGPQSDTVRVGIETMLDMEACMFVLGDQPLLQTASMERMLDTFELDGESVCRLSFEGTPSSPVLFPSSLFSRLRALKGDQGGMAALRGTDVAVQTVEAAQYWEILDADTEKALSVIDFILKNEVENPL